jgi:mannitol/fructose-specific phosphotransferase system IIA component (Ntr-type)
MRLRELLRPGSIKLSLAAHDKQGALDELVDLLCADPEIAPRRQEICEALAARERLMSTAIGRGVAIPHAELSTPVRATAAVGISPGGIDYDAPDGKPVHILLVIVISRSESHERIAALSTFSRMMRKESVRQAAMQAASADELIGILAGEEEGAPAA